MFLFPKLIWRLWLLSLRLISANETLFVIDCWYIFCILCTGIYVWFWFSQRETLINRHKPNWKNWVTCELRNSFQAGQSSLRMIFWNKQLVHIHWTPQQLLCKLVSWKPSKRELCTSYWQLYKQNYYCLKSTTQKSQDILQELLV